MFDLPETVTVWNKVGGSGYEGYSWSAPLPIDARYALTNQKVVDVNGADKISNTVVYFENESVKIDSKIYIGVSVATSPPNDARDVINFKATPSGTDLRVAFL